jgi:prepilin-type N-terminal cleavage/methylation domain-containing protein
MEIKKYSRKGFTLIELLISIVIFVIMMVGITQIFFSSFQSYNKNKMIQRDLESAQQALNLIAKTLRTSKIKFPVADTAVGNSIVVFDDSHTGNKCIKYSLDNGRIREQSTADTEAACSSGSAFPANYTYLTDSLNVFVNTLNFATTLTTTSKMGKVTINAAACPTVAACAAGNDKINIQTTVSLRDYSNAGL